MTGQVSLNNFPHDFTSVDIFQREAVLTVEKFFKIYILHKSIPVEVERFHCIFFTSTEQKDCIGEGIHLEVIPYDCHEAFKRLSHVCAATDQVDFLYSGQITDQSSRRADMV